LGFSLAEIREYLGLYSPEDNTRQLVHARKKFAERIAVFEKQKLDIDVAISELKRGIGDIDQHLSESDADQAPKTAAA